MASRNGWKELVLPCIAMVAVECSAVIATILIKAASVKGMSYVVFTAYCYILGTLVFLLLVSLFKRKSVLPQLKFPLFSRIFLIGLFGYGSLFPFKLHIMIDKEKPNPMNLFHVLETGFQANYACTKAYNLVPQLWLQPLAISHQLLPSYLLSSSDVYMFEKSSLRPFLPHVFAHTRIEKVAFRSSSSRAKIMGTFTSICGALGPKVFSLSSSAIHQRPLGLMSSESNWMIGGLLQAVAFVLVSLGYIIQSQIMKIYPEEVTVNFFCNLFGTIISLPICFLAEPNLSSWRLSSDLAAVAVLYSGLFGFSFLSFVHIWGIHLKGPFQANFNCHCSCYECHIPWRSNISWKCDWKPNLCTGLFCVLWGKAKEEEEMIDDDCGLSTTINGRVPLLQSQQS
ncbi:hypothetical protein CXB51_024375 [Gossypium anomalum]|uniref:WAT1-related protein n=1 Tax=Gossypium anomalum TaxID=47600 RepID=A0A8J5YJB6_9ROSI|nr:hypothetical protein CXB51_024375 [Gossypium anomalum]